jgi:hypothetical protein
MGQEQTLVSVLAEWDSPITMMFQNGREKFRSYAVRRGHQELDHSG